MRTSFFVVVAWRKNGARLHLCCPECLAPEEVCVLGPHLAFPFGLLLKDGCATSRGFLRRFVPADLRDVRNGLLRFESALG